MNSAPEARIAFFVPVLHGGGAERNLVDLAVEAAHRGLAPDLLVIRALGHYLESLPAAVRLIELCPAGRIDGRVKWLRCATYAKTLRALVRYLRAGPCMLISTTASLYGMALIVKRYLVKDVTLVVFQPFHFSEYFAVTNRRDRLLLRMLRRLLPVADAVAANSQGALEDLKRQVPAAAHLMRCIRNPVVTRDHAARAQQPVAHAWFGAGQPPVILAAGRLVPLKDHATLLKAFAVVLRERPARLVILGEGPERNRLTALAASLGIAAAVDLPGFQRNPLAWMAQAQVFAHTSVTEGSPNVLVQALACGTPVVSTDCPTGPREILRDGALGRLVPVGDWRALAHAMLSTLDDPVRPEVLIARADDFTVQSAFDRYLALARRIARGGGS